MITSSKAKVQNVFLRRRPPVQESVSRGRTVHALLSDLQTAYSVFVPRPNDWLDLFQIIFLLPDRTKSPRNTDRNLREVIQDFLEDAETDYQRSIATSFLEELRKVGPREVSLVPVVHTVSEESLRRAGFTVATPGPSLGLEGSRSRSTHRSLRLSMRSSDTYKGRKLRRLIWKHAEEVFCLILQELEGTHVSTIAGDKSLMGIVTRRLISDVGVSRVDGRKASGTMEVSTGQGGVGVQLGGDNEREFQEVYDDLHGVSGIHFIVFPIECLDMHRWRFYRWIDVCDAEMDESSSSDSRRRDDLYQASLWLRGAGNLNNAVQSNSKTVTDEDSTRSVANSKSTALDGQNARGDREYVDVTNMRQTVPFKDIDIRPVLSQFAIKQCKLAAFYRKSDRNDYKKTTRAVSLLRSALRKCRFESTIRALYDLSGCYLRGLGVQEDSIMGRLLRYCAGGMRRNYDTRGWWLRRLVIEIGVRRDEAPERSIGEMALLFRWRPMVSQEETRICLEQLVRDDHPAPSIHKKVLRAIRNKEKERRSRMANRRLQALREDNIKLNRRLQALTEDNMKLQALKLENDILRKRESVLMRKRESALMSTMLENRSLPLLTEDELTMLRGTSNSSSLPADDKKFRALELENYRALELENYKLKKQLKELKMMEGPLVMGHLLLLLVVVADVTVLCFWRDFWRDHMAYFVFLQIPFIFSTSRVTFLKLRSFAAN